MKDDMTITLAHPKSSCKKRWQFLSRKQADMLLNSFSYGTIRIKEDMYKALNPFSFKRSKRWSVLQKLKLHQRNPLSLFSCLKENNHFYSLLFHSTTLDLHTLIMSTWLLAFVFARRFFYSIRSIRFHGL